MSFIPKNSNKTQKDSIFSRWDCDRDRDRSNLDRWDRDRNLADLDREIAIAIVRSVDWRFARDRDCNLADFDDHDRRRSARSRSRKASIGAVPVTGEIAIVVHRCGWFRRSEGLTEQCVCEGLVRVREGRKRFEVKITTEINFSRFWLIFQSNWKHFQFDRILQHNQTHDFSEIDFRKSISVKTNGALIP